MDSKQPHDPILWSSVFVALLVALTAVAGIWWPATYARETLYTRAGGIASDLVDLFLVVPVLLASGILAYRGSVAARLVWLGTQGYLFYNFVIYAFGVHFNALVFAYCATLGACFYATLFSLPFIPLDQLARTYARAPRKTVSIVFLLLALPTAFFDLREDVAALVSGTIPPSIMAANEPVNFVHILDLAFLLPALCITAVLLFRRMPAGYALAPALLALLAIMSVELASLMAVMGRMGCFPVFYPAIGSFIVLALGFTVLLSVYFSRASRAG